MTQKAISLPPANIVAIHEGRKTMTRRLCKPQPTCVCNDWSESAQPGDVVIYRGKLTRLVVSRGRGKRDLGELTPQVIKPPYAVGDELWIKETHYCYGSWIVDGKTKTGREKFRFVRISNDADTVRFTKPPMVWPKAYMANGWYKRSARFMPKACARTRLRVTDVKSPERIQDITHKDCLAEGIETNRCNSEKCQRDFSLLWTSIYGVESWESNPWTWPIAFEKIEKD